jgi:hypothetical protein
VSENRLVGASVMLNSAVFDYLIHDGEIGKRTSFVPFVLGDVDVNMSFVDSVQSTRPESLAIFVLS